MIGLQAVAFQSYEMSSRGKSLETESKLWLSGVQGKGKSLLMDMGFPSVVMKCSKTDCGDGCPTL